MMSGLDLADLIAYARARGAKIILAGDSSQLQAVRRRRRVPARPALGYARLAEAVRFTLGGSKHASLGLRDGDSSVLAEYDQRGRINGGEPEQVMDAAGLRTSHYHVGTDTLLIAAGHALRRELSRRVREDLVTLGLVSDGPAVTSPAAPGSGPAT